MVEDGSIVIVASAHDRYNHSDEDECENRTIENIATDVYRSRKGARKRPTKFQSALGQDNVSTLVPIPFVQRILTKGTQASGLMMSRVGDTKTIRLCRKDNMDVRAQEVQIVGRIGY